MQRSFSRIAPYVAIALLGFAIVITVREAPPRPRVGGRPNLITLIARADLHSRELRDELDELQDRIEAFEAVAAQRGERLDALRSQISALGEAAGLAPVDGPGVRVELRDSTLRESPSGDPNDLVIHERDLQSVVNALWGAGAEAVAINGERLTATSAVRCVGNTLLLHGSLYAPPYRIEAIGDAAALRRGLDTDRDVERFRVFAESFKLGFDVVSVDGLELPAFRGVVSMRSARVR